MSRIRTLGTALILSLLLAIPSIPDALAETWAEIPRLNGFGSGPIDVKGGTLVAWSNVSSDSAWPYRLIGDTWVAGLLELSAHQASAISGYSTATAGCGVGDRFFVSKTYVQSWSPTYSNLGVYAEEYRILEYGGAGCCSIPAMFSAGGQAFIASGYGPTQSLRSTDGSTWTHYPPLNEWESTEAGCSPCSDPARLVAVEVFDDVVYVAGEFTVSNGQLLRQFVRLAGAAWTSDGIEMDGDVLKMVVFRNRLVVGGNFAPPPGTRSQSIGLWDGTGWEELGLGIRGRVAAMAVHNDHLYVGGEFTEAGGETASNIAVWNGEFWRALPEIPEDGVALLFSTNDGLIAVGWRESGSLPCYRLENVVSTEPASWGSLKSRFRAPQRD